MAKLERDDTAPGYEECNDPRRAPGAMVADKEDCHVFYSCVSDGRGEFIPYQHTCAPGTAFEESLQM